MKEEGNNILLIGIGNSGREDDGLGWAFIDHLKPDLPANFDVEYRYQLQIEDAEMISHYQKVYFIDADKTPKTNDFIISECFPKETHHFSSHALPPETILFLTNDIYNKAPKSFVIGISGESYELEIGLTKSAKTNLNKALINFKNNILMESQEANKIQ